MPNRDNTGPNGDGPETGRKQGTCPKKEEPNQGRSFGRGLGKGKGLGLSKRFGKRNKS
jgi:hypothetical protein